VSGQNRVEREGISHVHPARFILVGTMNPEEGELRPQFLDRFGLCVEVLGSSDAAERRLVLERWLAFEANPEGFSAEFASSEAKVRESIEQARQLLPQVELSDGLLERALQVTAEADVQGHRADIALVKTCRALSALAGDRMAREGLLTQAARLVLPHRMRQNPFDTLEQQQLRLNSLFTNLAGAGRG